MQLRLPHQSFRPDTRPVSSAVRLWWRYAFKAVVNQLRQGRPSWKDAITFLQIQRKYVPLYVKRLKESLPAAQNDPVIQEFDHALPNQVQP
jgi:hypothetical protein